MPICAMGVAFHLNADEFSNHSFAGGMEMRRLHAAIQVAPCHPFHGASAVAQTWRGLQEAIGRILIGNLGDAVHTLPSVSLHGQGQVSGLRAPSGAAALAA